jgi:hypothetical protein
LEGAALFSKEIPMSTTTLEHAVQAVQQRQQRLAPVDLVERLDRYHLAFPDDEPARMVALAGGSDRSLELSDHALGQILSRLGIPSSYFQKCPSNLKWAQANYWVQHGLGDKQSLLRVVQGDRVRAALSESYAPMDDADIVPMVADVLADEDAKVTLDQSDTHTHMRIVFPRSTTAVKVGDLVQSGIHISNSEVGMRAVTIDALAYRLICTNGAVTSDYASRTSMRHMGNPNRLKDYIRQAIADARDGAQQLIQQFKAAVDHKLSEPEKLIEAHAKDNGLSKDQLQAILMSFGAERDNSLFSAVQAFTDTAKRAGTFEARYQLEKVGTALLSKVL